ncbi:MAG: trypsin-like peptidase domain-containing protein [Solirubrobacteraceae bacterium]
MKNFLPTTLAGLAGGALAAGAILVSGIGDSSTTKTVVQQAPIASATPAKDGSAAPTAREIYKRDAPGVVQIKAQVVQQSQSPFDPFPQEQQGTSTGSGFVIDKSGLILTNAHVIDGASKVSVSFEDKKTVDAKVIGKDVSTDLALLKVDASGLRLTPLKLGDSKGVQVGDPTVAIGNPFGLDRTLTTGVVSALQREIQAPDGYAIKNVIQTDAAINPGNSGGPLIDATGRVIGINSQIATGGSGSSGGNVGIGFAVPINTAKELIPQLRSTGRVTRGYLGITGTTIDASLESLNLAAKSGVLVQTVQSGSPAAKAGIKGGETTAQIAGNVIKLGGDVIVKADGKDVASMDQLVEIINAGKPGDTISLEIKRDGKDKTVDVKLAQRPNAQTQG